MGGGGGGEGILADTCMEAGGWLMVAVNKQYNARNTLSGMLIF